MTGIEMVGDSVQVSGSTRSLTYRPRRVILDDGTWVAHASRGGSLHSVWVSDLGGLLVQVLHLGDGPGGGELILVVPEANVIAIGDLYSPEPPAMAARSWPRAIEQVLDRIGEQTRVLSASGEVSRDDLEAFRDKLRNLTLGHSA